MQVRSLGWEDLLEEEMATQASIYAWRLPWTEKPSSLQSVGSRRVQSLGWEDPLEKGMATHSSTRAWGTLWTEEPGRLQSMGSQRVVGHPSPWGVHAL